MAEVVGLRGQPVIDGRKPREDVIAVCDELLEEARSGEIVGVALVKVYHDEGTTYRRRGFNTYSMVGRLEEMKLRMIEDLSK